MVVEADSEGGPLLQGNKVQLVPVIEQALVRFAPNVYRGVVATEGFMGLT